MNIGAKCHAKQGRKQFENVYASKEQATSVHCRYYDLIFD